MTEQRQDLSDRPPEYASGQPSAGPVKVRTTNEARQGVAGQNVRQVLYWSLGGLVVVFLAVYFAFLK